MGTLKIVFAGVQAYVPLEDRLEIYMPNATRLGDSPQRKLPMHMPSLWQFDAGKSGQYVNATKWRRFPWCEVRLDFWFPNGEADTLHLEALEALGGPLENRIKLSRRLLQEPRCTAGKVVIPYGTASVKDAGDVECEFKEWKPSIKEVDGSSPKYPPTSILNKVYMTVENVGAVRMTFVSLIGDCTEVPKPVTITDFGTTRLVIGNPCAESLLDWPHNEVTGFHDEDFAWLYGLVGKDYTPVGEPVPVFEQRATKVENTDAPEVVVDNLAKGGGGGVGCECQGIVGVIDEEDES